jgi:hypothetical protein
MGDGGVGLERDGKMDVHLDGFSDGGVSLSIGVED